MNKCYSIKIYILDFNCQNYGYVHNRHNRKNNYTQYNCVI